jgi:hypothetical protein
VAQPGSALVWGARGRQFESGLPDKEYQEIGALFLCLKLNIEMVFMKKDHQIGGLFVRTIRYGLLLDNNN